MAYSGLFITANEKSNFYVFDAIFADIGDEQSISESLSTFSSHITNIINIMKKCTNQSLVLLDELGSGTDPLEGSSLAISILEYFNSLGSLTLCTSHYPELKKYCILTEGFENACVEFDINTLQPTYKLLIGVPGKSNAFSISKRLGLDDNIISRANELLKPDIFNIEELLKKIYDDKSAIESEKNKIEQNSKQIELNRSSLEHELIKIKERENKIIQQANQEARRILEDAKNKASIAIKEISATSSSSKQLNNIRNTINDSIKNLYNKEIIKDDMPSTNQSIKKGDTVFITNLGSQGIVISEPSKVR